MKTSLSPDELKSAELLELKEAVKALLESEWMVSCDWAPQDSRDAVLNRVRLAVARMEESS